ncbi:MAG: NAD(+) synthase, partial [Bacillota bacterium]
PLGDLQKTQVWELAREIDVPREIIERPPTAGLRGEEGDEDEMGVSYRKLDKIYRAWQNGEDLDRFDSSTVEQVKSLVKGAEDKDNIPTFKK